MESQELIDGLTRLVGVPNEVKMTKRLSGRVIN
jgi:hypothetical protein